MFICASSRIIAFKQASVNKPKYLSTIDNEMFNFLDKKNIKFFIKYFIIKKYVV